MKHALIFSLGLLWLAFACGFGFFLAQYVTQGAGSQFFIPAVSSGSVLLGLVHFIGLLTAALICFAIGTGFCARAMVLHERINEGDGEQREQP
jgi:hypothetical protein